jgi:hypothetical protein
MQFTVNVMAPMNAIPGERFDTEPEAVAHAAELMEAGATHVTIVATTIDDNRYAFRNCHGQPCNPWSVFIDGERFESDDLAMLEAVTA